MSLDPFFKAPQFSLEQPEKERLLLAEFNSLLEHHRRGCTGYARILDVLGYTAPATDLADLPWLPVSLFKTHVLASVPPEEFFKTMTSSGTTGQAVSRITLDRVTADLQSRALSQIMRTVLGSQRLPMIVIDTPNVVKDRAMFSARGAGVLGMIQYGRKHFYCLDDDMRLDAVGLARFADEFDGQPILLFGFTFMVWQHFLAEIKRQGVSIDLSQGILIHSGGWKKLADEAVGNAEFKLALEEATGLHRVHNFYGMVEQVGSVFLEGADGMLVPPNFADVIIRDPRTWEPAPDGEVGLIEVLSVLPRSYPGHVLLTEDLGVLHPMPADGWQGKRLQVIGRVPKAELRGCSDTHAFERAVVLS
jgi:hypothetical protein